MGERGKGELKPYVGEDDAIAFELLDEMGDRHDEERAGIEEEVTRTLTPEEEFITPSDLMRRPTLPRVDSMRRKGLLD